MLARVLCLLGIIICSAMSPAALRAADDADSPGRALVEVALRNIVELQRPGEDGIATVWDGNKYVQCRRTPNRALRCEAAGTVLQPTLRNILTPERVATLSRLGWWLDRSFGNYVQMFPNGSPPSEVSSQILAVLTAAYDADIGNLAVQTDWVKAQACPPRNGPGQNLAGAIIDAPAMAATAISACSYDPEPEPVTVTSAADLIALYGPRVEGEIQRLRVNIDRPVFLVLDTGAGYVQCAPETGPDAIYCEAQSADQWPALARILTPDRIAQLHEAGFADPGRAPNYWRFYHAEDADADVARSLLTILFDVYGYDGRPGLDLLTETGPA